MIGVVEESDSSSATTHSGWPVTLVRCRVAGGVRLYAFYELVDRGCVVTLEGASAAVDAARANLLAADVDWSSDELVAITQLWELV